MHGPLDDRQRGRLQSLIDSPSQATWEEAHSVILDRDSWTTLWQAILAIDPSFPRTGQTTDARGNVVAPWPRIPSPQLVVQAINYATH